MNQITFKQYRNIDLFLICVITAVFEAIVTVATNKWFSIQAMAVSITLAMTCIAIMRWTAYAVIPALVGSIAFCIASQATAVQYVIYCCGSIFCLLSIILVKLIGKDKLKNDFVWRSIFVLFTYIAIALGRWLVSLPFEASLVTLINFLTTDILSLLFAIVVMTLVKNVDGLIEDQKTYLLRLDKEKKDQASEN